jgi:hypothetical protein
MTTPVPASADVVEDTPVEFRELRLEGTGERWVNGLVSSYFDDWEDGEWPATDLEGVMTKKQFDSTMRKVNSALTDHWPCAATRLFAYSCCICTCWLSMRFAGKMVVEAEDRVTAELRRASTSKVFKAKQISWKLEKEGCCYANSSVVIRFPKDLVLQRAESEASITSI